MCYHFWLLILSLSVFPPFFSPPAGSSSVCIVHRGQDNNVKYLKAKLGVQEDKNPGSQALANNTAWSISVKRTHHSARPPRVRIRRSTVRLVRHVPHVPCHDDAGGLPGSDGICPAAIQGGTCSLGRLSRPPPQVSVKVDRPTVCPLV